MLPRTRHALRVLAALIAPVTVAVALGTVPAHADTYRTATSSGSGPTWSTGKANAENNARAALNVQAADAGEVCPSVSVSSAHVYTAPDGSAYVFTATASGTCVSAPSYTVPRSATSQGGGPTPSRAIYNGTQVARAAVLTQGIACVNWTATPAHVYTAPDGSWYIYNVTVSATCAN